MVLGYIISEIIDLIRDVLYIIALSFSEFFRYLVPQTKNLKEEVVLITGGGMGIGRLLALKCAAEGGTVVIWDLAEDNITKMVKECKDLGAKAYGYKVDVSNKEQVYATAKKVKEEAGRVTVLVNNAGIVTGKTFLECPDEHSVRSMNVNTIAHFWTVKAFLPDMIKENHGHLVTVASSAGLLGVNGLADYCASKFGAVGFHEGIAAELHKLGKENVHTSLVCPFYINTGMFTGVKTKRPWLLPILEPEYVADQMYKAIKYNRAVVNLPWSINLLPVSRIFPYKVQTAMMDYMGVGTSMDEFKQTRSHLKKAD